MKRLLSMLVIIFLSLIGLSCNKDDYDQRLEITDLQKSQTIILHKKPDQGSVYSLRIRCTGKLNDEARIIWLLDGTVYNTSKLNGDVDFKWGGDWYADSVEIRYEPLQANSGKLIIEYKFDDLK